LPYFKFFLIKRSLISINTSDTWVLNSIMSKARLRKRQKQPLPIRQLKTL
jgi:hypothetical protein